MKRKRKRIGERKRGKMSMERGREYKREGELKGEKRGK
jgi:hypothetical protein